MAKGQQGNRETKKQAVKTTKEKKALKDAKKNARSAPPLVTR